MAALHEMPVIVNTVKNLSQNEGMKDHEIAEQMKLSRETVQRIRSINGIPKVNLSKRCDKTYFCIGCEETHTIRREERKPIYCPDCMYKINNKIALPTKDQELVAK